jgi:hypothetical protein
MNLVTGARLTNQSGTNTAPSTIGIDGQVGPTLLAGTNNECLGIAVPSVARTQHTFAAIFKFTSDLAGLYQGVVVFQNQYGFYIRVRAPIFFTNADNTPSFSLTLGHSYFVAMSSSLGGSSPIFYVAKDLNTGQVFSSTVTQSAASGTGSSINVGTDTGNENANFPIAAAMCAETVLSMPQLLQWANSPWDFWYPRKTIQYTTPVTVTTATTGGARIRRRFNRSPLAYPAGAVPGVDLNHPVLAGGNKIIRSVIAVNGNLVDIPTALAGTQNVLPAASTDGVIGPVVIGATDVSGSVSTGQFFPQSVTAPNGITLAFLTRIPAGLASGTFHYLIDDSTGYFLELDNSAPVGKLALDFYTTGTAVTSAIAPTLGNPCLLLVTTNSSYSFFVIKDLITGKVLTDLKGGTTTPTSSETVACFNNYTVLSAFANGRSWGGPMAAAAIINGSCSPSALLQWAQSPWDFWYPNQTIQYTTPATAAVPTGGARIRQRFNRSPLAYPARAVPGIDPSHPASKNLVTSAVSANGGNMLDVKTGLPFTKSGGTANTVIDANVGPAQYVTAGAANICSVPGPNSIPPAATMAAIIRPIAANGFSVYQAIIVYNNGTSDNGIYTHFGSGPPVFDMYNTAVGDQEPITLGSGFPTAPYFIAVSDPYTSGQNVNFVAVNLLTGQVKTGAVSGASGNGSINDAFVAIGCDPNPNDLSNTYIAAAMYSRTYLSMQQLLQWAKSPWEFWYPDKTIELSASSATLFFLRPDGDSSAGGWTNELGSTPLFSSINESVANDLNYIQSSNRPSVDICKVSLANPLSTAQQPTFIRYRHKKVVSAGRTVQLKVRLLQGTTTIAEWTHASDTTGFVTTEQSLTDLQFAAITDFTNLFLEFEATAF